MPREQDKANICHRLCHFRRYLAIPRPPRPAADEHLPFVIDIGQARRFDSFAITPYYGRSRSNPAFASPCYHRRETLCSLQIMGSGTRISSLEPVQQVRSADFPWTSGLESRDSLIPDAKHLGILAFSSIHNAAWDWIPIDVGFVIENVRLGVIQEFGSTSFHHWEPWRKR